MIPASFANVLCNVLRDESGQGLVEYSLVIALLALVCIAALRFLARRESNVYSNITTSINAVTN